MTIVVTKNWKRMNDFFEILCVSYVPYQARIYNFLWCSSKKKAETIEMEVLFSSVMLVVINGQANIFWEHLFTLEHNNNCIVAISLEEKIHSYLVFFFISSVVQYSDVKYSLKHHRKSETKANFRRNISRSTKKLIKNTFLFVF